MGVLNICSITTITFVPRAPFSPSEQTIYFQTQQRCRSTYFGCTNAVTSFLRLKYDKAKKERNHTQYWYTFEEKRQSSWIRSLSVKEDSVSLKMRVTTWEKAMLSSPRPLSPLKFPLWQKRKSLKSRRNSVHPTFEKYLVLPLCIITALSWQSYL